MDHFICTPLHLEASGLGDGVRIHLVEVGMVVPCVGMRVGDMMHLKRGRIG